MYTATTSGDDQVVIWDATNNNWKDDAKVAINGTTHQLNVTFLENKVVAAGTWWNVKNTTSTSPATGACPSG